MAALCASVTVMMQAPVSLPGVTVKAAEAPAFAGVALELTCATKTFDVGSGEGTAGFGVQLIEAVNAAVSLGSETPNVAGVPPAVRVSEPGEARGVDAGDGVGVDKLPVGTAKSAIYTGCAAEMGICVVTATNVTVVPLTVAGPLIGENHCVPL
jgi:hypothetical protein